MGEASSLRRLSPIPDYVAQNSIIPQVFQGTVDRSADHALLLEHLEVTVVAVISRSRVRYWRCCQCITIYRASSAHGPRDSGFARGLVDMKTDITS
jgi:hypothetical protein